MCGWVLLDVLGLLYIDTVLGVQEGLPMCYRPQTNIKGDTMCNPFNVATKIVCLEHAVQEEELADDQVCAEPPIAAASHCSPAQEYEEIFEDMKEECGKVRQERIWWYERRWHHLRTVWRHCQAGHSAAAQGGRSQGARGWSRVYRVRAGYRSVGGAQCVEWAQIRGQTCRSYVFCRGQVFGWRARRVASPRGDDGCWQRYFQTRCSLVKPNVQHTPKAAWRGWSTTKASCFCR